MKTYEFMYNFKFIVIQVIRNIGASLLVALIGILVFALGVSYASNGEVVMFKAGMTILTDGVGASHGDQYHQKQTAYANGVLNADTMHYIALAPGWAAKRDLHLGDVVMVKYAGKTAYAIYGDNYQGDKVHGEGSILLAKTLGVLVGKNSHSEESEGNVKYYVYQGSNEMINPSSVNQDEINRIGKKLFSSDYDEATITSTHKKALLKKKAQHNKKVKKAKRKAMVESYSVIAPVSEELTLGGLLSRVLKDSGITETVNDIVDRVEVAFSK